MSNASVEELEPSANYCDLSSTPVLLRSFVVDGDHLANQLSAANEFGIEYTAMAGEIDAGTKKLEGMADRKVVRRQLSQASVIEDMAIVGAALVGAIDDDDERQIAIQELFKPFALKGEIGGAAFAQIAISIDHIVRGRRINADYSRQLVEQLTIALESEQINRFDLVKLVAGVPIDGHGTTATSYLRRATAYLLGSAEFHQNINLLPEIKQELAAGVYDQAIAYETLTCTQTEEQAVNPQIKRLNDLLNFARTVSSEPDDTILIPQMVEAMSTWPPEALTAVRDIRTALLQPYTRALEYAEETLSDDLALDLPEATQQIFDDNVRNVALTFMNQYSHITNLFGFTRTDLMKERVRLKRERQLGCTATENADMLPAETLRDPHPLIYVDASGVEYPMDSDKFKRMVDEYLSDYKGNKALSEDVARILDFMTQFDFRERIAGVKNYKDTLKRGDKKMAIFGFKPADADGCPKTDPQARKIRVLFSLIGDKLAVHAIHDRDKVKQVEKNLNIKS